jgi:molybdate transport system substrate-binding protein
VIGIPPNINVIAEYPIAVVANSAHPNLAHAWYEFVSSLEGQQVLARAGFVSPTSSVAAK